LQSYLLCIILTPECKSMQHHLSNESLVEIQKFDNFKNLSLTLFSYINKNVIGLSGGSTYKTICAYWAQLRLNLNGCIFIPVDERMVPFSDSESNWGQVVSPFLHACGLANQDAHHVQSASELEKLLSIYGDSENKALDTVFLGVGEDGHTASLFPGGTELSDFVKPVVESNSPKNIVHRISLGRSVFKKSKTVIMVAAGMGKSLFIDSLLNVNTDIPAVAVLADRSQSILYLDEQLYDYYERKKSGAPIHHI
jgi:6-phosphogluconolactonase